MQGWNREVCFPTPDIPQSKNHKEHTNELTHPSDLHPRKRFTAVSLLEEQEAFLLS